MWPCLAVLLIGMATPAEVETDAVRIAVTLNSHIYMWDVTNLGTEPITSFEIEYHRCYQHIVPEGWEYEVDRRLFRAWATDPESAILPDQTRSFRARTASGGNALGTVTARVGLGPEGQHTVVFEKVWGPVKKSRGLVGLVAVLVAAIAAFHAVVLSRRERSVETASISRDP
ncbi:MAG: hypothetical protein ACYTGF_01090 [Planctomycetota bacterium]|jgi:hypothetical protein